MNRNKSKKELANKYANAQKAMVKESFEKVFWRRMCKFYAPNRMEDHYQELDEELKKAGLYAKEED